MIACEAKCDSDCLGEEREQTQSEKEGDHGIYFAHCESFDEVRTVQNRFQSHTASHYPLVYCPLNRFILHHPSLARQSPINLRRTGFEIGFLRFDRALASRVMKGAVEGLSKPASIDTKGDQNKYSFMRFA